MPRSNELTQFQPGQSGNPAGRPEGARSKLTTAFMESLHDDFIEHGLAVIELVRQEQPAMYLKIVASLMPRHAVGERTEELSISMVEVLSQDNRELARRLALIFRTAEGEA